MRLFYEQNTDSPEASTKFEVRPSTANPSLTHKNIFSITSHSCKRVGAFLFVNDFFSIAQTRKLSVGAFAKKKGYLFFTPEKKPAKVRQLRTSEYFFQPPNAGETVYSQTIGSELKTTVNSELKKNKESKYYPVLSDNIFAPQNSPPKTQASTPRLHFLSQTPRRTLSKAS
mgnify:FL=1